jgi:hypothetical protein
MEFLSKITTYLHYLSRKEQDRLLMATLASVALLVGGLIYFIHQKSTTLVASIKKMELLANKAVNLLQDYDKIQTEEDRIQAMLEKQKDFNIKIYFEQFCKEHNIMTSAEWDTSVVSINPQFDEITLPATFKDQTTEKLVKILEEIDKREIIYIKNLSIKTEKEKKHITVDITIATKKSK